MSDTKLGEEVVEETTQEAPAPEPETQEVAPQEEEEKQVEPETTEETETNEEVDAPPKDNKAWAKMRVENKQLKNALEESSVDAEYLEQLKGITRGDQDQEPEYRPITQDTDLDTAVQGINEARQLAYQTRRELAQLRLERREQEDREAEIAFPALKSDPVFQQIVAEKRLAAEIVGRRRPTVEIAREVDKLLSRREQQVAAQATEDAEARSTAKQRVTTEPQTTSSQGQSSYDDDELKLKARKGDRESQEALAKKLLVGLDFSNI